MKLCDEAEQNLDESKDNCFSVKLPSGVTCEVKMEDITCLEHDAIVNPANGDLKHVGGLAYEISRKGYKNFSSLYKEYVDVKN